MIKFIKNNMKNVITKCATYKNYGLFNHIYLLDVDYVFNDKSIADIIRFYYPKLNTVKKYKNIHSTVSSICRRKSWKNI